MDEVSGMFVNHKAFRYLCVSLKDGSFTLSLAAQQMQMYPCIM